MHTLHDMSAPIRVFKMLGLKEKLDTFRTFWDGFKTYQKTGETPHDGYEAMRKLFVETDGWFNDIFQFFYGLNKPKPPRIPLHLSIFEGLEQRDIDLAVENLNRDGYYIFPQLVPNEYLEELMEFALNTPVSLLQYDSDKEKHQEKHGMFVQLGNVVQPPDTYFDPTNLVATNYHISPEQAMNNEVIQTLMADPAIINIAQEYVQSQVAHALMNFWWTTPYGCENPSSSLAQQFHFDMDRFKFIKFFLYLTDVGPGDGPHSYVRNSAKRKPKALQRDGRFSDKEIADNYNAEDIKIVCAPRGTLIAGDTRSFHKAQMPTTGNRLMMNFELATCGVGATYPRVQFEIKSEKLEQVKNMNPYLWSNYDVIPHSTKLKNEEAVKV